VTSLVKSKILIQESKGDYEESSTGHSETDNGVLFDIDAIRAELASEQMEIKELISTLPPMKLDLSPSPTAANSPRSALRETKSYDASKTLSPSNNSYNGSTPRLNDEGEIKLSFDTSYESPARSVSSFTKSPNRSPQIDPPLADSTDRAATLQRPELKSSTTMPVGLGLSSSGYNSSNNMSGMNISHNAWADEDDDDFGQEKEMEMTFA